MVKDNLVLSVREELVEFLEVPTDLKEFFDVIGYLVPKVQLAMLATPKQRFICGNIIRSLYFSNNHFAALCDQIIHDAWCDRLNLSHSEWGEKNSAKGRELITREELSIAVKRLLG